MLRWKSEKVIKTTNGSKEKKMTFRALARDNRHRTVRIFFSKSEDKIKQR